MAIVDTLQGWYYLLHSKVKSSRIGWQIQLHEITCRIGSGTIAYWHIDPMKHSAINVKIN